MDGIERLCLIDRLARERASETPAATQARGEAAMRRAFPNWR